MKKYDLSETSLLSFEINNDCNLKKHHPQCPINVRKYRKKEKSLNVDNVVECIRQAKHLNFNGYVAFHNYNEPLLCKNQILEIIQKAPDVKYLLWTNGLLLSRDMTQNEFLKKFDLVYISCYDLQNKPFFEEIQQFHPAIHVETIELDDRLDTYTRDHINQIACKRPLFDLPIDYYGNIHLCCFDWNNEYEIGNIFDTSFKDVILSQRYQNLIKISKQRLLDYGICPDICKRCRSVPMVMWKRYVKINLNPIL